MAMNLILDSFDILDGLSSEPIEDSQSSSRSRKRTNTNSLTRKKKLRSDSIDHSTNTVR